LHQDAETLFCLKRNLSLPSIDKKTMGGIVSWPELRKQIRTNLLSGSECFVTTLIDYYGLNQRHDFPKWNESLQIPDIYARIELLELAMKDDIEDNLRYRFIPYLQLHEFEGLLFNDINVFYEQIPQRELIGIPELKQTFEDFENPELINNNPETSPSHRLARIIKGYNKVVYGNIIAEAIGLDKIRAKSPRFNNWLNVLESE